MHVPMLIRKTIDARLVDGNANVTYIMVYLHRCRWYKVRFVVTTGSRYDSICVHTPRSQSIIQERLNQMIHRQMIKSRTTNQAGDTQPDDKRPHDKQPDDKQPDDRRAYRHMPIITSAAPKRTHDQLLSNQ